MLTAYYRFRLNQDEQKVYDEFLKGMQHLKKEISICGVDTSKCDVNKILSALNLDNPRLFYVNPYNKYSITSNSFCFYPIYNYSKKEYEKNKKIINKELKNIEEFQTDKSDIEKVREVHDRLVRRIKYGKNINREYEAHSIVGALVDYTCVCEGYAKLFKCIMDDLKVKCIVVFGQSYNPDGSEMGAHAWNIVRVDEKNYQLDVTWDSIVDRMHVSRAYYLLSDDEMKYDHKADEDFILPKCAESFDAIRKVEDTASLIRAMQMDRASGKMFSQYRLKQRYRDSQDVFDEIKNNLKTNRQREMYSHVKSIWYGKKRWLLYVSWKSS